MSTLKMSEKTTTVRESRWRVVAWLLAAVFAVTGCSPVESETQLPSDKQATKSDQSVKLIFVHHSCGENWLADSHGGLGRALAKSNYFLSDTNYGWGPDGIGDRTDITNWPEWFTGPRSREYLQSLYRESGQHCEYTRTLSDPGGENEIVMFKSCFPNSNLEGNPSDKPKRGEGLTVANAKAIYNELLGYFATRPEKLFVVVTAPPLQDRTHAPNARAFNKWLVQNWLADYRGKNVVVFDFYNVLTGPGNHHRFRDGKVEYTCDSGKDTLHYPSDDDHPSPAGNRKATAEFVPLLNAYYKKWAATRPRKERASKPPVGTAKDTTSKKTPMAVETPPQTEPSVITDSGEVIDDFEGKQQAWTKFLDAEKNARLRFSKNKTIKHNGAASLCIQYDLTPESWATCALTYDRPRDWSRSVSLSFYLHAEKPGQPITIIAYGGKSSDDLLHFEYEFKASQAAVDGWQRVDIPWSRLKLPQWQGDSKTKYDSRSAMGVGFSVHSSTDGRQAGKLWIDDVTLSSRQPAGKPQPQTNP